MMLYDEHQKNERPTNHSWLNGHQHDSFQPSKDVISFLNVFENLGSDVLLYLSSNQFQASVSRIKLSPLVKAS